MNMGQKEQPRRKQDSGASQKLEEERILRKSKACQMLYTDKGNLEVRSRDL